jgi:hypothetical protein
MHELGRQIELRAWFEGIPKVTESNDGAYQFCLHSSLAFPPNG